MSRYLRKMYAQLRHRQTSPIPTGLGAPSRCMFGDEPAGFVVYGKEAHAFVCAEHLGPFVNDWIVEREISVVRL